MQFERWILALALVLAGGLLAQAGCDGAEHDGQVRVWIR